MAQAGCVAIKVQYQDGCPRSGADVKTLYTDPIHDLGSTNETGWTDYTCGVLNPPGPYYVQATYGGSVFGPPQAELDVDSNGDGSTTIQQNFNGDLVITINRPINNGIYNLFRNYYDIYDIDKFSVGFTVNSISTVSNKVYILDGKQIKPGTEQIVQQGNPWEFITELIILKGASHSLRICADSADSSIKHGSSLVYFTTIIKSLCFRPGPFCAR
jgi:hypothetical protein